MHIHSVYPYGCCCGFELKQWLDDYNINKTGVSLSSPCRHPSQGHNFLYEIWRRLSGCKGLNLNTGWNVDGLLPAKQPRLDITHHSTLAPRESYLSQSLRPFEIIPPHNELNINPHDIVFPPKGICSYNTNNVTNSIIISLIQHSIK